MQPQLILTPEDHTNYSPGCVWDHNVKRITLCLLLVAFLAMVMLVAASPNRFVYDEPYFAQYVLLLHEHGFNPTFLNSLNASPGPLSAVVQVIFEPLTQLRPVAMRFVNVFLLMVLVSILVIWLKREGNDYWVAACSVLVVPMTWVVAGMALSEMSAMVFVTLSLYLQLTALEALDTRRSVVGRFLVAGVCLGIAIWGRQPYLLLGGIPAVVALMEPRLRMPAAVFVGTVTALVLPLFLIWRGFLPPSQHSMQEGFSVIHGLASFGYAGSCFILLAPRCRLLPVRVVVWLVVLTVIANASLKSVALYPVWSLVNRHLTASAMHVYGNLCGSLFLSCGVVFLAILLRTTWLSREDLGLLTVNAGLLCIAAWPIFFARQYSSRYTAMSLPYLILVAQPWRRWRLETVIMSVLGCGIGFLSLFGYFSR